VGETAEKLAKSSQLADVFAIPDHLRDALWRVEGAPIKPFETEGLIVCGVGGSGVGGVLARAALGRRLAKPFLVSRDYAIPSWIPGSWAVLCASYSGQTEETLSCFREAAGRGMKPFVTTTGGPLAEAAREAGAPVVGIPSIGMQPRSSVGYLFTVASEIAGFGGVSARISKEIEAAADWLETQRDNLMARAAEIAGRIDSAIPLIYGNDLTAPVAYRWKTQINENAELPAFSAELPEADHNEIMGWGRVPEGQRLAAVFLADRDQGERQRERIDLTASLVEPHAAATVVIETEGNTRTERLLWAVMLGDIVSLHIAIDRGVDPEPIGMIDELKSRLGAG